MYTIRIRILYIYKYIYTMYETIWLAKKFKNSVFVGMDQFGAESNVQDSAYRTEYCRRSYGIFNFHAENSMKEPKNTSTTITTATTITTGTKNVKSV